MNIQNILSDRKIQQAPSWQIIYEWEDILANKLNIPIVYSSKIESVLFKILRRLKLLDPIQWIDNQKNVNGTKLYFAMYVEQEFSYGQKKNIIPVIIDYFMKDQDLTKFYSSYRNCSHVLISSLEVVNYLKDKKCPLNIHHFPLSIPDRYELTSQSHFEKSIDVLMAGRKNPVLYKYLEQYALAHPEFEFVYQTSINGKLAYESNKSGIIGEFHSREAYISLVKSAKISFYATPGIDGGESRTAGFNPVTPRFFELLAAGCLLMGRYPATAETEFFELNEYCPNINSYNHFEEVLEKYLSVEEYPKDKYINYLNKHYTSVRAKQLREIFK